MFSPERLILLYICSFLDFSVFCGRGVHCVPVEPSLRLHRSKTGASDRIVRCWSLDGMFWIVADLVESSCQVCLSVLLPISLPTFGRTSLLTYRASTFHDLWLVIRIQSRCIAGFLNGNIGVMKSMMGEITDATNRAQGFALFPITYAIGNAIGYAFPFRSI
jgi:hypothetical protein